MLLLLAGPLQLAAQQTEPSRFLHWIYRDAAAMAGAVVDGATPLYALGAVGVLFPVSQADPGINPELRKARSGGFGQYLDITNEFGGPGVNLPVAGVFALTLLTPDHKLQDAAFTSLQSLVYAGAIGYGLKYAFGRVRPDEGHGAHRFRPFSGKSSFPSGHATTAFAVLTPWVLYYPGPATYGLFAISTGTALSRLARDKHWATDVLSGSVLGFATAYWLTRRHQSVQRGFSLTPVATPDAVSLTLRLAF